MSKTLKKIWEEFVYGGHLVASGSVIIVICYGVIRRLPFNLLLIIGVYLITYLIHLFDRYNDIKKESSAERISHFKSYEGKIKAIIVISLLGLIAIFMNRGLTMIIIAILLLSLGFAYGVFFKKITKFIIGFKSYYTSLAFASVIIFATYYYNAKFDLTMLLIYLFFVLRWFCNTTFCDIKDIDQDRLEGLKTFAATFNKKLLYKFFYSINILSIVPLVYGVYLGVLPGYSLFLSLSLLYCFYYLFLSKKENANFQKLSNVWADGESAVWLLLIVFGRFLWA